MVTSMLRQASLLLAGLACAGSMTLAQAAPMTFSVPLAGSQEVPPVQTQGTGNADLTYDPDTRVVKWNVTFSGLSGAATMAHFHGPAPAGTNASPVVWLSQKGAMSAESPLTGQATLSPANAQALLTGNLYINVHTKDHPDGEIRGQVVPPK
ncbi:CHRD domain-containing protein [Burkholderia sp. Ac-20353]|uniref:CHRD domain-containing protein n=1 Tax=Burkholderia sp. Ac-20353 TaxID=2703894 RepID=UPI00197C0469|nr:CHRD domain-containing protein [Burkholderia sp. Ac-20353]